MGGESNKQGKEIEERNLKKNGYKVKINRKIHAIKNIQINEYNWKNVRLKKFIVY